MASLLLNLKSAFENLIVSHKRDTSKNLFGQMIQSSGPKFSINGKTFVKGINWTNYRDAIVAKRKADGGKSVSWESLFREAGESPDSDFSQVYLGYNVAFIARSLTKRDFHMWEFIYDTFCVNDEFSRENYEKWAKATKFCVFLTDDEDSTSFVPQADFIIAFGHLAKIIGDVQGYHSHRTVADRHESGFSLSDFKIE